VSGIVRLVRGLTRPLLAMFLDASCVTLTALGIPVPEQLWALASAATLFWFAQHVQAQDG